MKSCSSHCSSSSCPRGRRAATSSGSDPGDRSLWPALPGSGSSQPPKLYPPLPVSTDKKGRETLELSRDCALPESWREQQQQQKNRQEVCNASCYSGKVYLRPSRKPPLPQGQDSPPTGPNGGPGAPLQPNHCAWCVAFGHWKNECTTARKEEEAPAVVGLADLEIKQGCQGSEISGP